MQIQPTAKTAKEAPAWTPVEGQHNHVIKVQAYIKLGIINVRDVQYLNIYHDTGCALLQKRGLCNCDPEFEVDTDHKRQARVKH